LDGHAEPYSQFELIGRDHELDMVRTFLDKAAAGGAALSLSGEAGVGKTVLLDACVAMSSAAGFHVLRGVGAEFETNLSFSGINAILSPLWSSIGGVESVYQDALRVALGFAAGPRPDELLISNAAMALLGQAASRRPLLVIIDDAQWLDQASMAVLAFAARRGVAGVGFHWASRSGRNTPIECRGVPTHAIGPISDDAAGILLDSYFPTLAPRVHQRLIVEAAGNPLALMELPTALSALQLAAVEALPCSLPLTARLQALFEARISGLPERTRAVLLLAALDGGGELRVLQAAADTSQLLDDLAHAERARLIDIDDRVIFRHPLIRSSVAHLSTGRERGQAHRPLASALLHHDRHQWHLGEASFDPDERVAATLDKAALRAVRRGDLVGAACMATRAASLTPDPAERARRLAVAAYQAVRSGAGRTGSRLLAGARQARPEFTGSLDDAIVAANLLICGDGDVSSVQPLLVDAVRSHPVPWGDQDTIVTEALHTLSIACWLSQNAELWKSYSEAVSGLTPQPPAGLLLKQGVLADPARATATSLTQLERALVGLRDETEPTRIIRTSVAARYVDRMTLCREPLRRIVEESAGRADTLALDAVRELSLDGFFIGLWDESERLANEGIKRTVGLQYWLGTCDFSYVLALIAAGRGDDEARPVCVRVAPGVPLRETKTALHLRKQLKRSQRPALTLCTLVPIKLSTADIVTGHLPCLASTTLMLAATSKTGTQQPSLPHHQFL
jgi:AAA ATPase domain